MGKYWNVANGIRAGLVGNNMVVHIVIRTLSGENRVPGAVCRIALEVQIISLRVGRKKKLEFQTLRTLASIMVPRTGSLAEAATGGAGAPCFLLTGYECLDAG
jgi:hypothetical protein